MKCCVIGLGVFGRNLSRCLAQLGADVLVVDRKDENIASIKDDVGAAVVMDFADPTPLESLPIAEMDVVVVAIGDKFEDSMAITVKVQELGPRQIVCRVLSPMHERILRLMKVDRLVVPEEYAARGLAHSLLMRGVVNGFDMGSGHAIIEARAPAHLVGKNLSGTSSLFRDAGVRLITIKRVERSALAGFLSPNQGEERRVTLGVVELSEPFRADDVFVLFGREKGLRAFLEGQPSG
ncbi:MAG: TrkA family potassium uptake protein [Opitutaceae bacterium]|nr:TrkA family potassium uptake protein [Opitutaceae bacterium]